MADNFSTQNALGATIIAAADEIAGVYHTRMKMQFGEDGTAFDVSATNPLPVVSSLATGAATGAKQDTGNTSLASMDTKTPALVGGAVPTFLTSAQIATLTPYSSVGISGSVAVTGTFFQTTQPVSGNFFQATQPVSMAAVPTGAATEARQTTGNTSLANIDSKIPALGQGTVGASVPVVLPAAQITALTPLSTVEINNDSGNPIPVADGGSTTGGLTMHRTLSAATTNATNVKSSAGQVYALQVFNVNAAARYLKLYNSASAPTAGAGTPVKTYVIPGNTAGNGFTIEVSKGMAFSSGIGFTITAAMADNDTTAVAANEIVVNIDYK